MSIFQRTIENVLKDLPGCCVRIDDILISGESDEVHLENLHRVLTRLQDCGLKLNPDKFFFMLDKVEYLGTTISSAGISPTAEKGQEIKDSAAPTNISELQSFLVPELAKLASPLSGLLRKEVPWRWSILEQDAFDNIKAALCSDSVLRHYDPMAELIPQCNASSVDLGAALLQPGPDGVLQPVAHVTRVISCCFWRDQYRQYLLGRHFKLLTGHKPLITLLGEHKSVPQLAAARIKI